VKHPTLYRTTQIDGLSIFYREARSKDAPTLLAVCTLTFLSRMFEPCSLGFRSLPLVSPRLSGLWHSALSWPRRAVGPKSSRVFQFAAQGLRLLDTASARCRPPIAPDGPRPCENPPAP